MAARADTFDLARLRLTPGEAHRLDLEVALDPVTFGAERYAVLPQALPVRLDLDRTVGSGWALRLRFSAGLEGPCMRCLEPAQPTFEVDAREVDQPGGGEELSSPYVREGELDLRRWAQDALVLALPAQVICRETCAGLCALCGEDLNAKPHEHEPEPDPRWAKLSELRFE
ncbi:MAG TPA: DUF177 domain-containing protein [Solirubrobacteraceae bacterium]|nr:DUF177 domain-containing protein [Solirubrobacteraceae bacterium]